MPGLSTIHTRLIIRQHRQNDLWGTGQEGFSYRFDQSICGVRQKHPHPNSDFRSILSVASCLRTGN
jgi:hypothetical protein